MHLRGRFVGVALASMIGGAAACGGDSTGPGASAASVTGVAGDNQTAPTGATLVPLSFTALNSSGQPAQGVHVTWSVSPSGAVSFSPRDSTTDASGSTSTTVTTTSVVGNVTISAKVTGVPDVVYHVTVLDPCSFLTPLALGQTINGRLATTDCSDGFFLYDFYKLSISAGQQNVRVDMHADTNDTYLVMFSGISPFPFIAFNDDSILTRAGARNSQLDIVLPVGDYIVGATSFGQLDRFAYSVAASSRPASMNGCREVWVVSGVTVTDDISALDCTDSSATPRHYDVARIFVPAGNDLSLSEHSTAINPSLALYRLIDTLASDTTNPSYVRQFVTSNDDSSATNTNAFISFTVDTSNYYDVIISTSAGGETGAYTFSVGVAASPSARYPEPANRAREWWRTPPTELLRSRGLRSRKL